MIPDRNFFVIFPAVLVLCTQSPGQAPLPIPSQSVSGPVEKQETYRIVECADHSLLEWTLRPSTHRAITASLPASSRDEQQESQTSGNSKTSDTESTAPKPTSSEETQEKKRRAGKMLREMFGVDTNESSSADTEETGDESSDQEPALATAVFVLPVLIFLILGLTGLIRLMRP